MNRQERRRQARTSPDQAQAQTAQAFQLYQTGQIAAAEVMLRRILREAPGQPEATRLLGEVLTDLGQAQEAIAMLRRFVQGRARDAQAHYALANAYRLSGQQADAIAAYQASLKLAPGFAGALHGLGAAYRRAEREAEAAEQFRLAVAAAPDWAPGWRDLGLTLAFLGELDNAAAALQRAVTLAPDMGEAMRALAALRPEAVDVARLAALAAHPRTPPGEKIDLLFALGRRHDANGEYDAAFRAFAAANKLLRAATGGLDRARLEADVSRIIAAFPAGGFPAGLGDASEAPVFILGMPRAGSSLFEQIAASHPAVFGAGERNGIGEIATRLGWEPGPAWTAQAIAAAARDYLAGLRGMAGEALRIIDKMPDNVFQLGLIAALFPNARVIFCARDARDTAVSCFFQHFSSPLRFDTDLDDCAFRIGQIERLMAHWRRVLKLRWTVMDYEALLAAPEAETRRMIEFLGLDWDPHCLDFHKAERTVRTASWAQVRQELYHNAAGRWRHYAAYLPPALLAAGEMLRPG